MPRHYYATGFRRCEECIHYTPFIEDGKVQRKGECGIKEIKYWAHVCPGREKVTYGISTKTIYGCREVCRKFIPRNGKIFTSEV